MMYSAYKLNKQGDNIQPWRTPFPIWNQSVILCPILTAASWPPYRFLRRQVRWSGIHISWRIFHSLLWSTALNIPLICLIFLKRSLAFPILLFSSIFYFFHWLLRKAFLSLLVILWNAEFKWVYISFSPLPLASLIFSAICKASSDNHFAFLHFFFLGMVLITASCTMSQTFVYSSSGTPFIKCNPLNLFVTSTV